MSPASTKRMTRLQLVKPPEAAPESLRSPGRVRHDARGNAVWDWNVEPEELEGQTVQQLLGSLAVPVALSLEGEERTADWSGDPYNRSR